MPSKPWASSLLAPNESTRHSHLHQPLCQAAHVIESFVTWLPLLHQLQNISRTTINETSSQWVQIVNWEKEIAPMVSASHEFQNPVSFLLHNRNGKEPSLLATTQCAAANFLQKGEDLCMKILRNNSSLLDDNKYLNRFPVKHAF